MSIVFITIPGKQKREFANLLHKKTGNGISYVIIQKPKKVTIFVTLKNLIKTVGLLNLPKELWYALLLRLSKDKQNLLLYFLGRTEKESSNQYIPKVIEVDSINGDEVYRLMKDIRPNLLVVWGTQVLRPHIFTLAKHAINLHMGIGEYYRGAVANHFAVLNNEKWKIGATIHYLQEKVDTGDALSILLANTTLPPKELFKDLHDKAEQSLLDISYRLWKGEKVEAFPQKIQYSRNILLREWIPSRRYAVAERLEEWEGKNK